MSDERDPIARAIEICVYGPIGLGCYVRDMAPSFLDLFVARGRVEVDRRNEQVQQRVTTARSLGQVALAFGPPVVRSRVTEQVDRMRGRAEEFVASRRAPAPESEPADTAPVTPAPAATAPPAAPATPSVTFGPWSGPNSSPSQPAPAQPAPPMGTISGGGAPPASDELPIPGYDALSASQVVERLAGLSAGELDSVRDYENANRRRRTILGKIEQLIP
jgi:hypothetical protein